MSKTVSKLDLLAEEETDREKSHPLYRHNAEASMILTEKMGIVTHINSLLKDDLQLESIVPIDPQSDDIFQSVRDGILLCKIINAVVPETIKLSKINIKERLNRYEMVGNIQTALVHAKEIGIRVINVGADDFMFPRAHLVLGILWQLVRLDLILKVGQLAKYLSEDIRGSESSNGEEILLRWVNFHLKEAKHPRVCTNFGADIKDSEIYVVLLTQLAPKECSRSILEETDLTKRAELFLQAADRVNCRQFIKPSDIVGGIDRLNLAFVANLFTEFNKKKRFQLKKIFQKTTLLSQKIQI